jgi:AsmA protein
VNKHPLISLLAAIVVLLLLAVMLAPLFIHVEVYRPKLEIQLSQSLGRKVTLGELSFSVLSASVVAHNVSIADDPVFSSRPFLQAQSLHIGVELVPLLLHRRLIVTRFVADSPAINLVRNAQGTWNFSDLGRNAASRPQNTNPEGVLPNSTVAAVKVVNGTVTVSNLPATGAPFVYSALNLSAEQWGLARSFPFSLTARMPGGGALDAKGNAGPVDPQDASETPLTAAVHLQHFDPVAAGLIRTDQGISMLADITAQVSSNGRDLTSNGTVHAARLKLVANGAPTSGPIDITYTVRQNLEVRSGQIDDLGITTGGVTMHVTGTYTAKGSQVMLALRLAAPNLPIDRLEALLPAVGVRLPSGSSLRGGALMANLAINGPASAPTISGPLEVDNTRLEGFDLSEKIGGLRLVSERRGGTQIQTVRADVSSSSEGTRIDNLYASIPAIGTATGSGNVFPQGGLDFQLVAKLNTNSGVLSGLTAVSGGIPVHVTGTTTNPLFHADLSQLLQKDAANILRNGNSKDLLNKLFHH